MLCSIRTTKSGSNWLDRLRSTKGFPAADHLDLDHFLSNPEVSDSPATSVDASVPESALPPSQRRVNHRAQIPTNGTSTRKGEWYGVMSNVLSELFNMGDPDDLPRKKVPRKQTNPRICPASFANSVGEVGVGRDDNAPAPASTLGSDNNSVEVKEENGEKELLGYSRSEVTVIDTSYPDWKFDKLVFRRRNVWKVRDKKGKPRSLVGKKKRKWGGGCNENVGLVNKKVKVSNSELGLEKEVNCEELLVPSNDEQNPRNEKRADTCIERPDNVGQASKKRISFSGSPKKSRKVDSSVVLIKGIPTSKRSGVKFPNNCIKMPRISEA